MTRDSLVKVSGIFPVGFPNRTRRANIFYDTPSNHRKEGKWRRLFLSVSSMPTSLWFSPIDYTSFAFKYFDIALLFFLLGVRFNILMNKRGEREALLLKLLTGVVM